MSARKKTEPPKPTVFPNDIDNMMLCGRDAGFVRRRNPEPMQTGYITIGIEAHFPGPVDLTNAPPRIILAWTSDRHSFRWTMEQWDATRQLIDHYFAPYRKPPA